MINIMRLTDNKRRWARSFLTIYSLGWGCNICDRCNNDNFSQWPCDWRQDFEFRPDLKRYNEMTNVDFRIFISKIEVHGITNYDQTFPTYEQFK